MKQRLSIGFKIVGAAFALIWGLITIIHFFYFANDSSISEWFTSIMEVFNWATINPYVFWAIGILGILSLAGKYLMDFIPSSSLKAPVREIIFTAFFTVLLWFLSGLILTLLFGRYGLKEVSAHGLKALSLYYLVGDNIQFSILTKGSRYYIPLFMPLVQLMIVNYLLTIVFFLVSCIFGRGLLRVLSPKAEYISTIQEFLFSTAIGLGAFGLTFFLVGVVHLLYPVVVGLLVFAGLLLGLSKDPDFPGRLWTGISGIRLSGISAILFATLIIIVVSSMHSPLYPVHMHDAMNSHLEAPKVFIRDHAITFHPYINFNNFPLGIDMLYIPMLMLERPVMTQITSFLFFILCLAVAYEMGRVYLRSSVAGLVSAIALCLIPHFIGQLNHPTIDIGLTFYLSILVLGLAGWLYAKKDEYILISGLILGFGLSVKYTGLPFALLAVIWVLFQKVLLENAKIIPSLKAIGKFALIATVVCSPWYVRNIVLFGNPFFPFYDDVFQNILPLGTARELKPELRMNEKEMLQKFKYEGGIEKTYDFLPAVTLEPRGGMRFNHLGPVFLAFLPFILYLLISGLGKLIGKYVLKWDVKIEWSPPVLMVAFFFLAYTAYWTYVVGILHTRYLFPVMPLMAVLTGYVVNKLFHLSRVNQRNAIAMFLVGMLCMISVYYYFNGVTRWPVRKLPLLENSRDNFLRSQISSYQAVLYANKTLGPDDIVYGLFAENCRFYANFTLIGGLYGYADHLGFNRNTETGQELYEYLKGYGCTYLIVDRRRLAIMSKSYAMVSLPRDPTFLRHFELIGSPGSADFYKIID